MVSENLKQGKWLKSDDLNVPVLRLCVYNSWCWDFFGASGLSGHFVADSLKHLFKFL
jgi:hypothetical protein